MDQPCCYSTKFLLAPGIMQLLQSNIPHVSDSAEDLLQQGLQQVQSPKSISFLWLINLCKQSLHAAISFLQTRRIYFCGSPEGHTANDELGSYSQPSTKVPLPQRYHSNYRVSTCQEDIMHIWIIPLRPSHSVKMYLWSLTSVDNKRENNCGDSQRKRLLCFLLHFSHFYTPLENVASQCCASERHAWY